MGARTEGRRHLAAGPAGAHWQAVTEGLGHRDDVGLQALRLEREPVAGPPEPGLDLVEHQQRAPVGAELAHAGQVVRRRGDDAALPLDRLDQHRRGGAVVERLLERAEVVVGDLVEAVGHRRERRLLGRLPGGRQRGQGAAVEGAVRREHDVATVARRGASQLQRALVGLGPGIAEEHLTAGALGPAADEAVEGGRHLRADLVAVEVRDVRQRRRLPGDRLGHDRVRVAERGHGQAADEVQVAPAAVVEQERALAAHEGGGRLGIGAHQCAAVDGRHGRTMVPTPPSVKSSTSTAWGTRPSRMWAPFTPARTARAQAWALGTIPPEATPDATRPSSSAAVS